MWDLLGDRGWINRQKLSRRPVVESLEDRCAPSSIIDLGTLGGYNSYGMALNNSGMVVGDSYINMFAGPHAYCCPGGDGSAMTELGTLGGASSEALGINDAGQIVGGSLTSDGSWHAYVFDGSTMTDLGTLGGSSSMASAINNGGDVTGWSATSNGQ